MSTWRGLKVRKVPAVKRYMEHALLISTDDRQVQSLWKTVQEVFTHVTWNDFCRALDVAFYIQHKIKGRHCGNLGDKACQYLAVADFARARAPLRLDNLEIGTLFGGSCLMKLFALRDFGIAGNIVCIDPMSGFYGQETDVISGLPVTSEIFFENLYRFGFSKETVELRQFRSDAPEAIAGLEKNHFATLMIDGDHSYEGVQNDWHLYSQFVENAGMVLIDDYAEPAWPHVTIFVQEIQKVANRFWNHAGVVGTTFVVCRNAFATENRKTDTPPDIISFDQVLRQGRTGALRREGLREALKNVVEEELNSRLGKVYLVLGKNSLRDKRYSDCEGWLHRFLQLDNPSPKEKFEGFFQLGRCQVMQGQTAAAIGSFQIAMSVPSITVQNLFASTLELGSAFVQMKECSKAEIVYLRGLQQLEIEEQQAYHLYVRLGNLYLAEKKAQEAERYYVMALAVKGIDETRRFHPLIGLAKTYAMGKKYNDAKEMISAALAIDGIDKQNRCSAFWELANCLRTLHKHSEIVKVLMDVHELPGLQPTTRYQACMGIGEAWMNLAEFGKAADYFSEASSIHGIPEEKKNEAKKAFEKCSHLQPGILPEVTWGHQGL
jgi:tetratricopeptide (TPR) repeat protein